MQITDFVALGRSVDSFLYLLTTVGLLSTLLCAGYSVLNLTEKNVVCLEPELPTLFFCSSKLLRFHLCI